ncbi:predicted protein [Histoplasma mississippiense (nom. inval.)]|uniref:predicted protein n=1 Tax=Ajellomyces capsulatus (strain NAm1 / WU24) TaxID=2059318 RepID=UPI000157BCC6|nr:predicted protein [Histoplasma mississippiense (nom. inval.)]EDN05897.1 predicted protein [Histoplasma mississippiense (nom. inval.)]
MTRQQGAEKQDNYNFELTQASSGRDRHVPGGNSTETVIVQLLPFESKYLPDNWPLLMDWILKYPQHIEHSICRYPHPILPPVKPRVLVGIEAG